MKTFLKTIDGWQDLEDYRVMQEIEFDYDGPEVAKAAIDSMLVDSDTKLAGIVVDINGQREMVDLMVYGEVRIQYKDDIYRYPDEYPEELVEIIKTDRQWFERDDIYVMENNWCEVIFTRKGEYQSEAYGDICDGEFPTDIHKMENWLLDIACDIYE